MEDDNESLLTMGMQKDYVDINITEESTLIIDETEGYTFTAATPNENEKLKGILVKHQDITPQELLYYLKKTGTSPQGGRGE